MAFNSLAFLLFWIIFTILMLPNWKNNSKYLLISAASLFFYGFWKWEYIFLILLSGLIDYICGKQIHKNDNIRRKYWLYTSIIANLGILFSFKYYTFFIEVINDLGGAVAMSDSSGYFSILPIGISFYTFQSMSYTIDIYRKELKPTNNFLKFFSYLSMFPQLVAGPIVRARDVLDQLENLKLQKNEELYSAIKLIIHGFFKKMVLADGVAKYVNIAFTRPEYPASSLYWWSIAICFAIQIYCDFSGYSDIARGLAKMYGIHFPLNFDHPYTANSFKGFWTRWHISLSSWFKDYVYIPLGGSRKGRIRSHINMWITMCVSGLWHGASYTFLIWGALHALFLTVEREGRSVFPKFKLPRFLQHLVVIMGVLVAWIYFRAHNLQQANEIILSMFTFSGSKVSLGNSISLIILVFFGREFYIAKNFQSSKLRVRISPLEPIWLGLLVVLSFFIRGDGDTFIYFQF